MTVLAVLVGVVDRGDDSADPGDDNAVLRGRAVGAEPNGHAECGLLTEGHHGNSGLEGHGGDVNTEVNQGQGQDGFHLLHEGLNAVHEPGVAAEDPHVASTVVEEDVNSEIEIAFVETSRVESCGVSGYGILITVMYLLARLAW